MKLISPWNTLTALEFVISTKAVSVALIVPVEVTGTNAGAIDNTNIIKNQTTQNKYRWLLCHCSLLELLGLILVLLTMLTLQKFKQHKQIPVAVMLVMTVGVTGIDTSAVDNTSNTKNQTTQTNTCGCYITDLCRCTCN